MRRFLLVLIAAPALAVAGPAHAWTWPASGPVLLGFSFDSSDPYAAGQHRGIDVGGASGEVVAAPVPGVVTFAGTVPGSGKSVTILTADGWSVTLTQLGSIAVAKGAAVAEGDGVGTIGPSEDPEVSSPYVQLGVRHADQDQGYVDPTTLLPARNGGTSATVADSPSPSEPASTVLATTLPTSPASTSATGAPAGSDSSAATAIPVADPPAAVAPPVPPTAVTTQSPAVTAPSTTASPGTAPPAVPVTAPVEPAVKPEVETTGVPVTLDQTTHGQTTHGQAKSRGATQGEAMQAEVPEAGIAEAPTTQHAPTQPVRVAHGIAPVPKPSAEVSPPARSTPETPKATSVERVAAPAQSATPARVTRRVTVREIVASPTPRIASAPTELEKELAPPPARAVPARTRIILHRVKPLRAVGGGRRGQPVRRVPTPTVRPAVRAAAVAPAARRAGSPGGVHRLRHRTPIAVGTPPLRSDRRFMSFAPRALRWLVVVLPAFALGLLLLGARRRVAPVPPRMIDPDADRAPEDPHRARLAVCRRASPPRARGRLRSPVGRLRPLSPPRGERRAHGERDGRARHAGDGGRRPGRALVP